MIAGQILLPSENPNYAPMILRKTTEYSVYISNDGNDANNQSQDENEVKLSISTHSSARHLAFAKQCLKTCPVCPHLKHAEVSVALLPIEIVRTPPFLTEAALYPLPIEPAMLDLSLYFPPPPLIDERLVFGSWYPSSSTTGPALPRMLLPLAFRSVRWFVRNVWTSAKKMLWNRVMRSEVPCGCTEPIKVHRT